MSDFAVTIYHNPACGTSRNTLAMLRAAGYAPTVVDYLQTGWAHDQLVALLAAMAMRPRDLLRAKGTPALDLGLLDPGVADDELLSAMVEQPILVNRPIVVTPLGTVLARPSETVLTVLDRPIEPFTKENGEVVG